MLLETPRAHISEVLLLKIASRAASMYCNDHAFSEDANLLHLACIFLHRAEARPNQILQRAVSGCGGQLHAAFFSMLLAISSKQRCCCSAARSKVNQP